MKVKFKPQLVPKGFRAITVYPYVFVSKEKYLTDKKLINHEAIHIAQQKELLLIFFLVAYTVCFLWNLIKYRDRKLAYFYIPLEQECYKNGDNLNYLKTRKLFAWIR